MLKTSNNEPNTKILINSGKHTSNPSDIANLFAEQFNYKALNKSTYKIENKLYNSNTIIQPIISLTDVLREMNNLNYKKSSFSIIPSKILKLCSTSISKPLFFLFNKIIEQKKIPNEMKLSKVIPILKPGKPT